MINRVLFTIIAATVLSQFSMSGQKSPERVQPERVLEEGKLLFERGYYGLARETFASLRDMDASVTLKDDASFFEALSALRLEHGDAGYLFEKHLEDFPQSRHISHAYFRLGELAQKDKKDSQALRRFEKVDPNDLDKDVRLEFYYKSGYAYFVNGDYNKASRHLAMVKDADSKYSAPASYYYAHILYEKGDHEAALRSFEKLRHEPGFRDIIPYYIAQIYYMQGNYDKAIEYGTPLMAEAKGLMRTDLARVLGDSYFTTGKYSQAISYLSIVVKDSKSPRREDYYHLGLSFYFEKDYAQAASNLAQVTSGSDEMTQNAYYHLADCYLHTGDKKNARIAFEAASRADFDKAIKEDAMFNYLKLNYELSFSPFNEIVNSFMQFINEFPNSRHIDEAYRYLGQALLTTKNYREALAAMESIKTKSPEVYKAMQRVAYHRGLELFTNLQFQSAIEMFDYSLKYGDQDRELKSDALYWRAEAYYRLNNYSEAQKGYRAFLQEPSARKSSEYAYAHYNLGYTYFKQSNYSEARSWFQQFINRGSDAETAFLGDAYNRLGDTYFLARDFKNAISWYDKAAGLSGGSPDYAMFQTALSLGISNDHQGKIRRLDNLINSYPMSSYVDDAWYEMGRSYVHLGNLDEAIRCYKTVRDRFPKSNFARKAMLQLGLVFYNAGDLDQSMVYYKRVINEFPRTPEAEDALLGLRAIYLDRNDPNGFISYTNQIGGFARVDDRQRDSLNYIAAERQYMSGNCEQAMDQLDSYLQSFPDGRFALNAHFYKADCQYRSGKMDEALRDFEFVAGRGKSLFSEDAVKYAGQIHYVKGNYTRALDYFRRLEEEADLEENRHEALIGQMRALAKMDNAVSALAATEKVISNPRMQPEIVREARYLKASSHLKLGDKANAINEYRQVSANTSSKEGAESKYMLAQLLYDGGGKPEAEKEIFDFIGKGTPHQYWMAKSFILLSDIYADRQEYFQAVQYLESLLENYKAEDDDIRQIANERLVRYRERQ